MSSLTLYFKPTENCNLNCLHCYNKKEQTVFNPVNFPMLERFLLEVSDKYKDINFIFHGGEPSLLKDEYLNYVFEMVKRCFMKNELRISMQSNMTILYNDLINFYKKIDSIGTSFSPFIRFAGEEFKNYNIWLKNIKTLTDNNLYPHLVITLSKKYIKTATPNNLIQFLLINKIKTFHFEPLTKDGNAIKNWDEIMIEPNEYDRWKSEFTKLYIDDEYYNEICCYDVIFKSKAFIDSAEYIRSKRNCHNATLTINSDGTIGTCPNVSNSNIIGDITYKIDDILQSDVRIKLCTDEKLQREECLMCEYYRYCNGGCMYLDKCYEGKEFYNTLKSYYENDEKFHNFIENYEI